MKKPHFVEERTDPDPGDLSLISLAVLRTHESKTFPGGLIASLSFPWGASQGDADQGGYHLVWGRDMVETAGGLLAAGAHEEVHRALSYLQKTQQADGHWPQNMWLDGSAYWNGIQMDETALPILLVNLAHREKVLVRKGPGSALADGEESRRLSWSATARSVRKIVGRKTRAIRRSRSRRKSPRFWQRRISPM